jgi:2,3-dihydroxybenzoate decarboxylase
MPSPTRLQGAGSLTDPDSSPALHYDRATPPEELMLGKIAIEEHVITEGFSAGASMPPDEPELAERMVDTGEMRLAEMDASGVQISVLSLTAPGIQGETDARSAIEKAVRFNDGLAEVVSRHPDRYLGFAAVPMQDPEAAADELQRCVGRHGFRGALVNGYTGAEDGERATYYDDRRFDPFWERAQALAVPVYLHPREALVSQRLAYEGYPEIVRAAWGFGVETGTHAIRLILGGVFDRHPRLQVVLGHLGETLPFAVWRLEHRVNLRPHGKVLERPVSAYLRENFHVTTSGNFSTRALLATIAELGADRVLFAADYPYESMRHAAEWFDAVPLNPTDLARIGRRNAERLLGLSSQDG